MAGDLLEQLAQVEVPPPPTNFDRQLHERVNRTLIIVQLFDLAVRGIPWAMLHFGRALAGLVSFSLTGRFFDDSDNRPKSL